MRNTTYTYNNKQYKLSNHLENVLVTTSDLRKGADNNADVIADYYNAIVTTATDYYAFGSLMPARQFNSTEYTWGFNGKEMDNEISGNGNQYDYGFRIYYPRLGTFLSVDPLTQSFPWYTPYQFAGNKPIWAKDLDGGEDIFYDPDLTKGGHSIAFKVYKASNISKNLETVFNKNAKNINVLFFLQNKSRPEGGVTLLNSISNAEIGEYLNATSEMERNNSRLGQVLNQIFIISPTPYMLYVLKSTYEQGRNMKLVGMNPADFVTAVDFEKTMIDGYKKLGEAPDQSSILFAKRNTAVRGAKYLAHEMEAHVNASPEVTGKIDGYEVANDEASQPDCYNDDPSHFSQTPGAESRADIVEKALTKTAQTIIQ